MHNNRIDRITWRCGRCYVALGLIREQSCGSAVSILWLTSLSGSRLVWLCFRLRREQAIMKRSGGALPRAAWAGQLVCLGERRGRGDGMWREALDGLALRS